MINSICFLSSEHPKFDKRVFDKEALSLVENGFSVFHLCPDSNASVFQKGGVSFQTYTKDSGIIARIKNLKSLYDMASAINADAYHCNEVDSWFVGVMLKIFQKKKCVFDVHEHYPSTFAESRFPLLARPFVAGSVIFSFQVMLPFTDKLVLAKQTVARDFFFSKRKQVLVRNFSSLGAAKSISTMKKASESEPYFTMVHFGLINKLRGWPQMLDALSLSKNSNVKFQVIGEFNDGSYDEFVSRVSELGLQDRVKYFEWMPFEQAFEMLAKADIGIICFQPGVKNHVFAMPHKLFDYMLAEAAVLMPDFAKEVVPFVTHYNGGLLLDPSDPVDIANKIDYLISNKAEMRCMGASGRNAVLEELNWEKEAEKLLEMYKEL